MLSPLRPGARYQQPAAEQAVSVLSPWSPNKVILGSTDRQEILPPRHGSVLSSAAGMFQEPARGPCLGEHLPAPAPWAQPSAALWKNLTPVAHRSYQVVEHPHEGFELLLPDQPLGRRGALPCWGPRGAGLGFVFSRIQED